jgi:hypothetical protein
VSHAAHCSNHFFLVLVQVIGRVVVVIVHRNRRFVSKLCQLLTVSRLLTHNKRKHAAKTRDRTGHGTVSENGRHTGIKAAMASAPMEFAGKVVNSMVNPAWTGLLVRSKYGKPCDVSGTKKWWDCGLSLTRNSPSPNLTTHWALVSSSMEN